MMQEMSDEQLVVAVQSGDITSFEVIVRRYQRRLQYYVRRFVLTDETAEEIVQDTLFTLYQTIDRVDIKRPLRSYIYVMAKNKAIDFVRGNRMLARLDTVDEADDETDFIDMIYNDDMRRSVQVALQQLVPAYRRALELYYFDELSYKEMSKILRLPMNTVRTHLSRAKQTLKEQLSPV